MVFLCCGFHCKKGDDWEDGEVTVEPNYHSEKNQECNISKGNAYMKSMSIKDTEETV